jgi:hypothetical protein
MKPLFLAAACLTVFLTMKMLFSWSGTSQTVTRETALATALLAAKANKARLVELEETFSYCAACLVVKNQNADLREWVDYHLAMGISRYILQQDMHYGSPPSACMSKMMSQVHVRTSHTIQLHLLPLL